MNGKKLFKLLSEKGVKTVDEIRTKQRSNPTTSEIITLFDSFKPFLWALSILTIRSIKQVFFVRLSFIERTIATASSVVLRTSSGNAYLHICRTNYVELVS